MKKEDELTKELRAQKDAKMKIGFDKNGRKVYKFSHSVDQGGFLYSHKAKEGEKIADRDGLRNALTELAKQYELVDVTIKVYDNVFFLYFLPKPSLAPQTLIDTIQKTIRPFSSWAEECLWTGVYDLQENYLKKELEKWGFDCEQG